MTHLCLHLSFTGQGWHHPVIVSLQAACKSNMIPRAQQHNTVSRMLARCHRQHHQKGALIPEVAPTSLPRCNAGLHRNFHLTRTTIHSRWYLIHISQAPSGTATERGLTIIIRLWRWSKQRDLVCKWVKRRVCGSLITTMMCRIRIPGLWIFPKFVLDSSMAVH
jgi:hypothetical protein